MSFLGDIFSKFITNIPKFFQGEFKREGNITFDVNPVLTDRSAFEDIQMSGTLMGHVMKGDFKIKDPINDHSPFPLAEDISDFNDLSQLVPFEEEGEFQLDPSLLE
ncbi:MAG: hypothetical protein JKY13_00040, partial [Gammaproteobacteria bacterium]|nr:hypothetical protein [Gammaproteobacteria bacterium]